MKKSINKDLVINGAITKYNADQINFFFEKFNETVEPKDFVTEQNISLLDIDLEGQLDEKDAITDLIIRTFDDFIALVYDVIDGDVDNLREYFEYADTPNLAESMFSHKNFQILRKLLYAKYSSTVKTMGPIKKILQLNFKR